jgi:hypothetical protein
VQAQIDSLQRVMEALNAPKISRYSQAEVLSALERGDPGAVGLTDRDYFVASRRNKLFFRGSCPLAPAVVKPDRLAWPDSAFLLRAGYKKLDVPGC